MNFYLLSALINKQVGLIATYIYILAARPPHRWLWSQAANVDVDKPFKYIAEQFYLK